MKTTDKKNNSIIGYIGSKVKLYNFIEDKVIIPNQGSGKVFIDLFSGTTAVSKLVQKKTDWDIVANDLASYTKILFSEIESSSLTELEMSETISVLRKIDSLKLKEGVFYNEFSMGGTPESITDKEVFKKNVKLRVSKMENPISVETGDIITLSGDSNETKETGILLQINTKELNLNIKVENTIIFEESQVEGNFISKTPLSVEISKAGTIIGNDSIAISSNAGVIRNIKEDNQEHKTSRMFFKGEIGKKIDSIKSGIKTLSVNLNQLQKNTLLLFLLNYADNNRNTTGVWGAYLKTDKSKTEKPFIDEDLIKRLESQPREKTRNFNCLNRLATDALGEIEETNRYSKEEVVIYIDPPYGTRSYESNYHILDYLCNLDFNPEVIKENSKTGMRSEKIENPFTSKDKTKTEFLNIIKSGLRISNNIYISYSNEGLLKEEELEEIITKLNRVDGKISLTTHKESYKRYTSGENKGSNTGDKNKVEEIIWHIKQK